MFAAQNRASGLYPPVVYNPYQWLRPGKTYYEDPHYYLNLGSWRGGDYAGNASSVSQYKTQAPTTIISYEPYLVNRDPAFNDNTSSLFSLAPDELGTGLYKILLMGGINFPPILFRDFTVCLVLEYYPAIGEHDKTLISWKITESSQYTLWNFVIKEEELALSNTTKDSGTSNWRLVQEAARFPHPNGTGANKVVLCMTSKSLWVNGVEAFDITLSNPPNEMSQIAEDTEISFGFTENIINGDQTINNDDPFFSEANNLKWSEVVVYPKALVANEMVTMSNWLANRAGIAF